MRFFLLIAIIAHSIVAAGQIPLEEVVEDKAEMSDQYYGTFKFQGEPYSGQAISFHHNGYIKSLRSFKNGQYHGLWTEWYDNGNLKFQGNRIENKGNGLTKWWYPNGQQKKISTYKMDVENGVILNWFETGQIKQIRYFEDGVAFGGWTRFNADGSILDQGDDNNIFYRPFFGKDEGDGLEEASPSITRDGKTMILARYKDWGKKIPYIATLKDGEWKKSKLSFVDTLYNLSISPDGKRIIYGVKDGDDKKVFITDWENGSWSKPMEVETLNGINAGYFQIMDDGEVYFFARSPKEGLYSSWPDKKTIYSQPKWVDDAFAMEKSDSFDQLLNPDKNKLIVTQYYNESKYPGRGAIGFYYYEKQGSDWKRIKRLPIAYGWGATITPDNKFIFIRNDGLQYVELAELGIEWE